MTHSNKQIKVETATSSDTQNQLNALAQVAMPAGLNDLLAGIDHMLNQAQHTIDHSLQQSNALIEQSRQQLQQFEQLNSPNSDIEQAVPYSVPQHEHYSAHAPAAETATESLLQPSLTEQQNAAVESAKTAQQTMDDTIKHMQQQLLAQSKQYEDRVANKVATHSVYGPGVLTPAEGEQ